MPPTKAWNNFKFNYPLRCTIRLERALLPWFLSQQLYNRQTAHHIPALMWLSIVIPILLSILAIVCILLTLVVLMQRPKNEGLGAAFGSGVTENIFGAQTATVLTKATVYLGCIFFGLTLLLTVLTARQSTTAESVFSRTRYVKQPLCRTTRRHLPPQLPQSAVRLPLRHRRPAFAASAASASSSSGNRFRDSCRVCHPSSPRPRPPVGFPFSERSDRILTHPCPERGAPSASPRSSFAPRTI